MNSPRCSWRFGCVSSALMLRSWRLNYAHDDCHCATADQGIKRPRFHCYRHYLLALKTLHNSRFSRFKMPTRQNRKAKSKPGPAQETTVSQPEPQEGTSQAPAPQAEPDPPPPECPNSNLLFHNCQLHHSHWNYSVVRLVRRLVVNCC